MRKMRAGAGHLLAGAAKVTITPPVGTHQGGYALRRKLSKGIDRELYARALVLDDGRNKVGLVVADVVGLDDATVDEVRRLVGLEAGIPPQNLAVCFTHSHSAPGVGLGKNASDWCRVFPKLMAGAVSEAVRHLTRCRIGSAHGIVGGVSHDRTRKLGEGQPIDQEIVVLAAETMKGAPLAMLVNFACHPVVFGPSNLLISPDYPGYLTEFLERAWGGTAIFVNGCCGDIDPIVNGIQWGSGDAKECRRVAQALGGEALHAASRIEFRSDFRVGARRRRIELPIKAIRSSAQANAELRHAEEELARMIRKRVPKSGRWYAEHMLGWARSQAKLAEAGKRPRLWMGMQALDLGPEVLVGIPGEVFCGIGIEIKRRLKEIRTMVGGYANGCLGYIPTRQAFRTGGYATNLATHLSNGTCMVSNVGDVIARRAISLARSVCRSTGSKLKMEWQDARTK
ncbi:MAG: hypothetical protein L6455_15410 [Kiritimatiellae bacterium]|nr:hypothetical protein [Kiritimatiellia bacterium]